MLKVVYRCSLPSIMYIVLVALFLTTVFGLAGSVYAANPSDVDYNVYVKPSLSIIASTNTVSIDLNPNSKQFGTANLDVTVGTNNLYGYQLFMNTDSDVTSLERNQDPSGTGTPDGVSATIPTLSNSSSTNPCNTSYTSSTFTNNSWGYRINNNVDGEANCIDTTGTNFYSYTPGTLISSSNQATNNKTANLTFGAKIDYNKPAGQYDLTLKFKALPIMTTYYMQDIAASPTLANTICTEEPTIVLDKRDEQSYTIRRINGDCWMVENLKFTGTTMDSTTSNIAPQYTPSNPYVATYYSFVNNGGDDSSGECRYQIDVAPTGYDYSCIEEGEIDVTNTPINTTAPTAKVKTVWYNYAAASAGTITGLTNTDPQLYDICPAGWRLPNNNEIGKVIGNESQFNVVYGGIYRDKTLYVPEDGRWWSSNVGIKEGVTSERARNFLGTIHSTSGSDDLLITPHYRTFGLYVRCVMKGANINNFTYMQDFASVAESDAATGDNKKQQVLDSMVTNTAYSLADSRDTQIYNIKKFGDDNIWMTRNLAVGCNGSGSNYGSTATSKSLTSANSNLINAYSTPTATLNGVTNQTNLYNNSYMTCSNDYGAWYNFVTASAGTIKGATNSLNASYDICPAGWQLPPKSTIDSFVSTVPAADRQTVLSPQFGGFYSGGGAVGSTGYGIWWSSTRMNDTAMEALTANSGGYIGTGGAASRYYGFYIRCVAK